MCIIKQAKEERNVLLKRLSALDKFISDYSGESLTGVAAPQTNGHVNGGGLKRAKRKRTYNTEKLYQPWTVEDDVTLQRLSSEGVSSAAIAKVLKRTRRSVTSRLWNIKHGYAKPREIRTQAQ